MIQPNMLVQKQQNHAKHPLLCDARKPCFQTNTYLTYWSTND